MKTGRIYFIFLLAAAAFAGLAVRLFFLQCRPAQAEGGAGPRPRKPMILVPERPQRGTILDRRGNILAASNRFETLFAEPRVIEDVKETAVKLQDMLNYPGHLICDTIYESRNPGYVKILNEISAEQAEILRTERFRGIGIESAWKRHYPLGRLSCHAVGFVGAEESGLSAAELQYETYLTPREATQVFLIDAARKPIASLSEETFSRDGASLVLTIDSTIQQYVHETLARRIEEFNAESGLAVVMEPYSGEILAMVSLPDFDPADLGTLTDESLKNRVLTDPYEPGSIFKPIVAAAALDEGVIGYGEKIYCEDGDYHGKGFGRIGEYGNHRYGNMTVGEIIAESSNIGMAKIGQRMGKEKLYAALKRFGFGEKTGIDLPGEDSGVVRDLEKWDGYSVTRVPFGHEINVTAIQMIRAYAIIANGGRLVRPHLLKAIVYPDGTTRWQDHKANLAGRILKPEVAKWMVTHALTAVVNEGTGKKAALKSVQVFGKTGTANIAGVNQDGYDERNYIASFAGGAPAQDPRIVVLVSIRRPDRSLGKGYTGGTVCGPVAAEIIQKTLDYLR